MTKILVLHGPNLNLLGIREPDKYGTLTLRKSTARSSPWQELGVSVTTEQSNHEGNSLPGFRMPVTGRMAL